MPELTKEHLLEMFVEDIKNISRSVVRHAGSVEEAVDLTVYSILTLLDGRRGNANIKTPITLVVTETPKDDRYEMELQGQGWVSADTKINEDCYLNDALGGFSTTPTNFYPVLINYYRVMIETKGDVLPDNGYASKEHLLMMLSKIEKEDHQTLTKRHRWLGYIQGILCAYGLTTVDVERDFTRKIFNGN